MSHTSHQTITIDGKPVEIDLTRAAERALAERNQPLLAEMELYFSCLIRKQVRFRDAADEAGMVNAGDNLKVRFRPVSTAHCSMDDTEGAPPLEDLQLVKPKAYVPHWLRIDYRGGEFQGEFGYTQ